MDEKIIGKSISEEAEAKLEGVYTITLINKLTDTRFYDVPVLEENTLRQLFEEYHEDIGLNKNSNRIIFENKRVHVFTSDFDTTIKEFNLRSGDILFMQEEGSVW